MDCASRQFAIRKTVYKAKDGATMGSADGSGRYEPVVPDSAAESRRVLLCGKHYDSLRAASDQGIRYRALAEPKPKWNPFAQ